MNKYYQERKEKGICVQCGRNPAEPDHVYCAECRARSREYRKRWDKNHAQERRTYNTEWQRKRRERRQADGLCIQCGAPRMATSKCYCKRCYELNKANATRRSWQKIVAGIEQENSYSV